MSRVDILKDVFYQDGSLRDIYVCDTSADDWQKVLTFLHGGRYQVTFEIDGVRMSLPSNYKDIEKHIGAATQLLSIDVEGVCVNCHFFCTRKSSLIYFPPRVI